MNRARTRTILGLLAAVSLSAVAAAADDVPYDRKEDVIYGRKFGTALTMDVFTPRKHAKGIGVVLVVSGGFFSSHESIQPAFIRPLTDRGYTVFAVVHGSQPRFTVPEIVHDMNRAVRFIRHHAKDYGIDPGRIGVCGASAGGHLSLMLGTAGDHGKPEAKDPVDRESSRVQAVACFFPPTDFLNYGKAGNREDPRHRSRPAVPRRLRLPRARQGEPPLGPDHRRHATRGDRPPDLPGLSRHARRSAHADHPRRQGSTGPAPAVRGDRRQAQEGRGRHQAHRQAGRRTWLAHHRARLAHSG